MVIIKTNKQINKWDKVDDKDDNDRNKNKQTNKQMDTIKKTMVVITTQTNEQVD